jgi:hypothetical protein
MGQAKSESAARVHAMIAAVEGQYKGAGKASTGQPSNPIAKIDGTIENRLWRRKPAKFAQAKIAYPQTIIWTRQKLPI